MGGNTPRIEVSSAFRSPNSFFPLRPSGSSRMIEASQLETAVAARGTISPAGARDEKGEKNDAGCPSPDPSLLIYGYTYVRGLIVMG